MDWEVMRKLYLALTGIFDNIVNFFVNIGTKLGW